MESNHPRNVTPRNSVLKTGTATGPYPSPQACFYTAFCTLGRGVEIGVLWAQGAPGVPMGAWKSSLRISIWLCTSGIGDRSRAVCPLNDVDVHRDRVQRRRRAHYVRPCICLLRRFRFCYSKNHLYI